MQRQEPASKQKQAEIKYTYNEEENIKRASIKERLLKHQSESESFYDINYYKYCNKLFFHLLSKEENDHLLVLTQVIDLFIIHRVYTQKIYEASVKYNNVIDIDFLFAIEGIALPFDESQITLILLNIFPIHEETLQELVKEPIKSIKESIAKLLPENKSNQKDIDQLVVEMTKLTHQSRAIFHKIYSKLYPLLKKNNGRINYQNIYKSLLKFLLDSIKELPKYFTTALEKEAALKGIEIVYTCIDSHCRLHEPNYKTSDLPTFIRILACVEQSTYIKKYESDNNKLMLLQEHLRINDSNRSRYQQELLLQAQDQINFTKQYLTETNKDHKKIIANLPSLDKESKQKLMLLETTKNELAKSLKEKENIVKSAEASMKKTELAEKTKKYSELSNLKNTQQNEFSIPDETKTLENACAQGQIEVIKKMMLEKKLDSSDVFVIILNKGNSETLRQYLDQFFIHISTESSIQEKILANLSRFNTHPHLQARILKSTDQWNKNLVKKYITNDSLLAIVNKTTSPKVSIAEHSILSIEHSTEKAITDALPETKEDNSKKLKLSLENLDPRDKFASFLEAKNEGSQYDAPEYKEVRCYALTLLCIQYFQAYIVTGKELIKGLRIEQAHRLRNALVHQHQEQPNSKGNLVFSGLENEFLSFCKKLHGALQPNAGNLKIKSLLKDPYLKILDDQGMVLADQVAEGKLEKDTIKYADRINYTTAFEGISAMFNNLKPTGDVMQNMLEHAKLMLMIYRQHYCKRQALEHAKLLDAEVSEILDQCTSIRHAQFTLEEPQDLLQQKKSMTL